MLAEAIETEIETEHKSETSETNTTMSCMQTLVCMSQTCSNFAWTRTLGLTQSSTLSQKCWHEPGNGFRNFQTCGGKFGSNKNYALHFSLTTNRYASPNSSNEPLDFRLSIDWFWLQTTTKEVRPTVHFITLCFLTSVTRLFPPPC